MDSNNPFFDNIEKKTNVKKEDILKIANSVSNADFSDPKVVKDLIARIGNTAGVPVSKEKEEALVKAITAGNIPGNFASLSKIFGSKK
ncbi:stage VI sporulation protein F [Sporolactobacillus sp. CPB3-1]|uniref:Stage VI sporulation protein F n=1 Tax=Sporolactobacillus mangiferae TaxID=2940498 RepID=A0ABT0MAZ3_9BACL|nr:stage VI sporulation protein F [Sporolactobacillus mangiferae]MCL1631838.1 stage VI sporulation protein F [Sporolactobacillus mangiferae]